MICICDESQSNPKPPRVPAHSLVRSCYGFDNILSTQLARWFLRRGEWGWGVGAQTLVHLCTSTQTLSVAGPCQWGWSNTSQRYDVHADAHGWMRARMHATVTYRNTHNVAEVAVFVNAVTHAPLGSRRPAPTRRPGIVNNVRMGNAVANVSADRSRCSAPLGRRRHRGAPVPLTISRRYLYAPQL